REREHAHALAGVHARVVEVPDLRPLPARVPALVAVAKGEHALLGTRAFLVATGAADGGVVAARGQRLAQRLGLHDLGVPAGAVALRADALAHAVLVHVHAQLDPGFGRAAVAERDHLAELPGGVHVQQRDRRARRRAGLQQQGPPHPAGPAGGIPPHRVAALARHFAQDVQALRLQAVEHAPARLLPAGHERPYTSS